jgi:hypothetical protein
MRPFSVSALFLTVLVSVFGQPAVNIASTPPPKDPLAVIDAAVPFYDFSSPELKPWHLKATYQFYDLEGKPAEQGTWEYWWASPKVRRSSWARAGVDTTVWSTADGAVYRKATGTPLRYFERAIERTLLSPLPSRGSLDSGRMKLDLKMLPPQKPELSCLFARWLVQGKLPTPNAEVAREYCFELSTMALRIAYSDPFMTRYNQLVKTQGRYIAREVLVMYGEQRVFSVSVDAIEAFNPADVGLSPPADATVDRGVTTPQENGSSEIVPGQLIKKIPPVYPVIGNELHETGVVVLGAVIGTDGKVHDLEALAASSPPPARFAFAQSAVDAVKKWEYKPLLVNGRAVEFETIVNVFFSLGR